MIVVRKSMIHGRGVFAKEHIPSGTKLGEYSGKYVSNEVVEKHKKETTYFFYVSKTKSILPFTSTKLRYTNHSCDPNCEAYQWRDKIFFRSIKDIKEGEELFIDYNFDYDENDTNNYACTCGSKKCRGKMTGKGQGYD